MIVNTIGPNKIYEHMFAYTVGDQAANSEFLNVYIPDIMPFIKPSNRIVKTSYLNNVSINENKPSFNSTISLQKYIRVFVLPTCKFNYENNIIPNNTRLLCLCVTENVNDICVMSEYKGE